MNESIWHVGLRVSIHGAGGMCERVLNETWITATLLVIKKFDIIIVYIFMVEIRVLSSANTCSLKWGWLEKKFSVNWWVEGSLLNTHMSLKYSFIVAEIVVNKKILYSSTSHWATSKKCVDSHYSFGGKDLHRKVKRVWFMSWSAD